MSCRRVSTGIAPRSAHVSRRTLSTVVDIWFSDRHSRTRWARWARWVTYMWLTNGASASEENRAAHCPSVSKHCTLFSSPGAVIDSKTSFKNSDANSGDATKTRRSAPSKSSCVMPTCTARRTFETEMMRKHRTAPHWQRYFHRRVLKQTWPRQHGTAPTLSFGGGANVMGK